MFNNSITECKFPDLLKLVDITPAFKKGDVTDKSNYRPTVSRPTVSRELKLIQTLAPGMILLMEFLKGQT